MKPVEIFEYLSDRVIGQEEALRYVSVAIFKHLQGDKYGNLLLIGNSGTGKTTIMRGIEALYNGHDDFQEHRVVLIMNASTLATEEGAVDTSRLFHRLEERARQVLGAGASAEEIGRAMERATVCLDEIDKVSGIIGGKPYVTGINIQQALLTLLEGERVLHRMTAIGQDGAPESAAVWVDTGKMLFLCAGAFETLYDQVFQRVTSAKSGVKLPTTTTYINGKIQIREYFTLRHHFRQEDLFDYGMQPQFLSRFDNAVILEDLTAVTLSRIFRVQDGVFHASRSFFEKYGIELEVTDAAVQKIAEEAAKSSRIGARALKSVYGRIIKPFEFDPFSRDEVQKNGGDLHKLTIDEKLVGEALKPAI